MAKKSTKLTEINDKTETKDIKPTTTKKKQSTANRGMKLEHKITKKCEEYIKNNIACIYKIPTDWVCIRKGAKIVTAYPRQASIIDFLGCYKDKAIGIEAKEVNDENRFPFSNIKEHQWLFFKQWCNIGALGYYIINFKPLNKYYLIKAVDFQNAKDTLDRKSAPITWFQDENNAIDIGDDLDFLKYIN